LLYRHGYLRIEKNFFLYTPNIIAKKVRNKKLLIKKLIDMPPHTIHVIFQKGEYPSLPLKEFLKTMNPEMGEF